jgi:segregation and condensation protein B
MNTAQAKTVIETALLCAGEPLGMTELRRLFADSTENEALGLTADAIREALDLLREEWRDRGLELVAVASGWRFQTRPAMAVWLERLRPEKPPRYSRAVLETLAVVAYRQPVTRGDIEQIRGVTVASTVVRALEERGWIETIGHRDTPGRPALFATTKGFLDDFGIRAIADLPTLEVAQLDPVLFPIVDTSTGSE